MLLEFQKTWKVYKTGSLFSPDEIRCDSRLCLLGTSINNHHRNSFKLKLCSYGVYNGNGKTIPGNCGSDLVQFKFGVVNGNIIRYKTYNIDHLT